MITPSPQRPFKYCFMFRSLVFVYLFATYRVAQKRKPLDALFLNKLYQCANKSQLWLDLSVTQAHNILNYY